MCIRDSYYTLRKEILVQIDTVTAGVKFVSEAQCMRVLKKKPELQLDRKETELHCVRASA